MSTLTQTTVVKNLLILSALLAPALTNAADYYVSTQGSNGNAGTDAAPWRSIQYAVDRAQPGDTVLVKGGTYRERVDINTSGRSDAWLTLKAAPGATVVLDGSSLSFTDWWHGLVDIQNVSYIRVEGLRVQHGQWGVIVRGASHIEIRDNATYDTVRSGIGVWQSSDVKVDGNSVELAANNGSQECISIAESSSIEVTNNEVFNDGAGDVGGEGIDIKSGSSNVLVRGNHVHDLDELGIYVDAFERHSHDIIIEDNLVNDCKGYGIAIGNEEGGLLENVIVRNNVTYRNSSMGIVLYDWMPGFSHPVRNVLIVNNTSVGNSPDGGWGAGIAVLNGDARGVVIRNNISVNNGYAQILDESGGAEISASNNLISGPTNSGSELAGSARIVADPLFVDAAAHNYRLSANSPAIDAGIAQAAPDSDYDGTKRPINGAVDIGAFEYAERLAEAPPATPQSLAVEFSTGSEAVQ